MFERVYIWPVQTSERLAFAFDFVKSLLQLSVSLWHDIVLCFVFSSSCVSTFWLVDRLIVSVVLALAWRRHHSHILRRRLDRVSFSPEFTRIWRILLARAIFIFRFWLGQIWYVDSFKFAVFARTSEVLGYLGVACWLFGRLIYNKLNYFPLIFPLSELLLLDDLLLRYFVNFIPFICLFCCIKYLNSCSSQIHNGDSLLYPIWLSIALILIGSFSSLFCFVNTRYQRKCFIFPHIHWSFSGWVCFAYSVHLSYLFLFVWHLER